jgi:ABC-type lipoprotein export system ATPase subunit
MNLFEINHLEAVYEQGTVVLSVDGLKIPRNKITVLLGPSGGGKTTLLEIIGLMHGNFSPTSDAVFYPTPDGEGIDVLKAWNDENIAKNLKNGDNSQAMVNGGEAERIRSDYYSFVFQQTNFMENFTACENVMIGKLRQEGATYASAKRDSEIMLRNELGINDNPNDTSKEYSGGQRQRMAFARAMASKFTVLFGDEPTGNLDHFSSHQLWLVLKDFIENPKNNASAIIVSHSIDLALKYADNIMVLTKNHVIPQANIDNNSQTTGFTISPIFIYDREKINWQDNEDTKKKIGKQIERIIRPETASLARVVQKAYSEICPAEDSSIVRKVFLDDVKDNNDDANDNEIDEKDVYLRYVEHVIDPEVFVKSHLVRESPRIPANLLSEKTTPYTNFCKANDTVLELFALPLIRKFIGDSQNSSSDQRQLFLKYAEYVIGSPIFDRNRLEAVLQQIPKNPFTDSTYKSFDQACTTARVVFSLPSDFKFSLPADFSFLTDYRKSIRYIPDALDQLKDRFAVNGKEGNWNYEKKKEFIQCFKGDPQSQRELPDPFKNKIHEAFYLTCLKVEKFSERFKSRDVKTHEHTAFKELFMRNESGELLGEHSANFWKVFFILTALFLSLGFTFGSLKYAKLKLSDPTIKYLYVYKGGADDNQGSSKATLYEQLIAMKSTVGKDFSISDIGYFSKESFTPKTITSSVLGQVMGRSIEWNNPIIDQIIKSPYLRCFGKPFIDAADPGIIISYKFLSLLRNEKTTKPNESMIPRFVEVMVPGEIPENGFQKVGTVHLPVRAVVRSLPDNAYFWFTNNAYLNFNKGFAQAEQFNCMISKELDPIDQEIINNSIKQFNSELEFEFKPYNYGSLNKPMVKLQIFNPTFDYENLFKDLKNTITEALKSKGKTVPEIFYYSENLFADYSSEESFKPDEADCYVISFDKLNKIAEFSQSPEFDKYNLNVETVNQMLTLSFVSLLAKILAFVLFVLSAVFVYTMLASILTNHLIKIRMNLGTFKAFGIDVKSSYMFIMRTFLLLPLALALIVSGAFGYTLLSWLMTLGNSQIEKDITYFSFSSLWFWLATLGMIWFCVRHFNNIIIEHLKHSPSTLINGKEESLIENLPFFKRVIKFFSRK